MIVEILLCALLIGDANLSSATNIKPPRTKFPSLNEAGIEDLAEGLKYEDFTSVDLINAYTARINEVNDILNAVVEINPDAILIASTRDNERSMGTLRGPLHGIPILIKDVIATNDNMNNTAGSYALIGAKMPADSTIARKLREAGAIILAKSNSSQWGHFRLLNISNGWSSRGGQTYGPYFPRKDPSGSSSGSAVVARLGLAMACLGAATSGLIIAPSHYNTIVALGLTSRHLVVPVSEHMETIGPMTKTVKDAAHALESITGVDSLDNHTSAIPYGADLDFVNACNISALQGTRLGAPRYVTSFMSDTTGAIVNENTDFPSAQESVDNGLLTVQIVAADFVVAVEKYLNLLVYNPHNITDLPDLREWTQSSPLEGYPSKPTDVWDAALKNWNNTDYDFWRAYKRVLDWGNEGGLLGVIERYKLDAVVLPSLFSSDWAAVVGAPIISVPMGAMPSDQPIVSDADGLVSAGPNIPFGFSFLGARFTDAKLIGLAYAFEQITMKRRTVHPYIKPKTDLRDVVGMHCQ
ncbi:hypothetical protein BGAL_0321g00090 [Botrytis galanthina]|uniref:Amidase domain-containing protein n=1 Tax=Botrytis galanthina TaxID=278940 RepID=A0A4S8R2B6_9HELO|nr:hypothetical protein BGAL_0321g00090 [Botrytis galanthina]